MVSIQLLALDPEAAEGIRHRLADAGLAARTAGPSGRGRPSRGGSRLTLVCTGASPLVGAGCAEILAGVAALEAPRGLVAWVGTVDPTSDAVARLQAGGVDVFLGAFHQRDLEVHVGSLLALARRMSGDEGPAGEVREGGSAAVEESPRWASEAQRYQCSLRSLEVGSVRDAVARAVRTTRAVLIAGEYGSGRRHAARIIHHASGRFGEFVEVEADALLTAPEGIAEAVRIRLREAALGTLCLLNAGRIDADSATALNSVLAATKDVRLIAIAASEFRGWFEAAVPCDVIEVPPLRSRGALIDELVLRYVGAEVADDALTALRVFEWPGNVRDLIDVLEGVRRQAKGRRVELAHLPKDIVEHFEDRTQLKPAPRGTRMPSIQDWQITENDPIDLGVYQRKAMLRALAATGGNRGMAAELLGVAKSTFYRKLEDWI